MSDWLVLNGLDSVLGVHAGHGWGGFNGVLLASWGCMTKERNRLTARFCQFLFFFLNLSPFHFLSSFLAPQVSPFSLVSQGGVKTGATRVIQRRLRLSTCRLRRAKKSRHRLLQIAFAPMGLLFLQLEDHPPPPFIASARVPPPPTSRCPRRCRCSPAARLSRPARRIDASMTCRERWTETTGPCRGG